MLQFIAIKVIHSCGLFTLPDTDSETDSDLDSKLCRNCYHCTDSDSDSDPQIIAVPIFGMDIRNQIKVRLPVWHYK